MYCSGGGWESSSYDPPTPEPPKPSPPRPGEKAPGVYGDPARLGSTGMIAGRFMPLHKGHQYLIEFALASVEKLRVLVYDRDREEVDGERRAQWIRELYPSTSVDFMGSESLDGAEGAKKFAADIPVAERPQFFFASELRYRIVADALGATFVPVDPTRQVMQVSGEAIKANVMENFGYLARNVRPWFVRRIAIVGAESTGKTTLCARLREQFRTLVVPEWTRVLAESGITGITSEHIQMIARSQIASEDALANQLPDANAGVLLCDTELQTIYAWASRLFDGRPPEWIQTAAALRPFDLYLVCAPDIPYVGPPEWNRPIERLQMHEKLTFLLSNQASPHVVLKGPPEERFRIAADAIIDLFAPSKLLSRRAERWLRSTDAELEISKGR
jgi:HTH-type transcriptional regulator, transcriptional repressor of NAD biosynthesis genes